MSTWNVPPDFQSRFLAACLKAATDDEAFANFRNDPDIGVVVHNTPQWWEDMVPVEFHGETPTETRHNYTVNVIEILLGGQKGCIIEIGGGYGGLCRAIQEKWKYKDAYFIYDHPAVNDLQRRYIKEDKPYPNVMILPGIGYSGSELMVGYTVADLCIAWASWSELHHEAKMEYLHKVMIPAKHLFIGINWDYEENKSLLMQHIPDLREHHDEFLGKILYK